MVLLADLDDRVADTAGGKLVRSRARQNLAGHGENLAGARVDDRLGQLLTVQAAPDVKLFVELVAADAGDVIAARVEEQALDIGDGVVECGRLAGAQTAVDLEQTVLAGSCRDPFPSSRG